MNSARDEALDDLRHRPIPVARGSGVHVEGDFKIGGQRRVAIAGRNATQINEGFDAAGLIAVLTQLRQLLADTHIEEEQRQDLLDRAIVIEQTAEHPQPDAGLVGRLARRLGKDIEQVAVAAGSTFRQHREFDLDPCAA